MMLKVLVCASLALIYATSASATTDKVVCYLGSWSNYRNNKGKFVIEDIDATLCTHVIYSFAGINADGSIRIMDTWLDISLGSYKRLNALKQVNHNLKTLIAIGGFNEGSLKFSAVVSNAKTRAAFVKNVVDFVATYGFDGFDLDWEYPAQRGGAATDKINFGLLTKELRAAFDKANPSLLLTAAVLATKNGIDTSYDVPVMSKYLNFINIMAYDLHGPWDHITGINAPLYAHPSETTATQKQVNVDACITAWINAGAPPEKIVLGLGMYGKSFTLSDKSRNGIGAPASGSGTGGPYTLEDGMLGYNEICELQMKGDWTVVWEDTQKVPYAYKGNQWVGYDNVESISIKVEYAKSKGLGGLMIWSIETDDFLGTCGPKYPLLNTINKGIGNTSPQSTTSSSASPSSTTEASTASPSSTTASSGSNGDLCSKAGYVRDPIDCATFYNCVASGAGTYTPKKFTCQKGLHFDVNLVACNYENLVNC